MSWIEDVYMLTTDETKKCKRRGRRWKISTAEPPDPTKQYIKKNQAHICPLVNIVYVDFIGYML